MECSDYGYVESCATTTTVPVSGYDNLPATGADSGSLAAVGLIITVAAIIAMLISSRKSER